MPESQLPADDRPGSVSSDISSNSSHILRGPNLDQLGTPSDNLSSLGSDIHVIHEYENVLPEILHYEPVVLPKEQTLEEILKQASGSSRLDTVKDVKLCVISYSVGIQRISSFCPLLVSLNLEGSIVNSLRDLGCFLTCLKRLNVSRCGLNNLDGTNGLVTLTHLVADYNNIEFVEPVSNLTDLQELSLIGNALSVLVRMDFLCLCLKLRSLNVIDNPIASQDNYDGFLKDNIPNLVFLDGVKLRQLPESGGKCDEDSLTSNSDSTSSLSSPEKSFELFNFETAARPQEHRSSSPRELAEGQSRRRPATTGKLVLQSLIIF